MWKSYDFVKVISKRETATDGTSNRLQQAADFFATKSLSVNLKFCSDPLTHCKQDPQGNIISSLFVVFACKNVLYFPFSFWDAVCGNSSNIKYMLHETKCIRLPSKQFHLQHSLLTLNV